MLAVGDSARLEILFSTGSYSGEIIKRPLIETNDPSGPHRVEIRTNVVANPDSTSPIGCDPYKLNVSQYTPDIRDRIDFSIENRSAEDLDLYLVDRPEGLFSLTLPGFVEAGSSAAGQLVVLPEALDSSFQKSITVRVSDMLNHRFTIPVVRSYRPTR